ncbi:MFS transporter [Asanoa sp. WMMD1127]|uniref:MFS transporter n=1 Tax=Asanoa sp. WMMD1127 TaxID=3016107 RepID=UPI0024165FC2|nr:MFS transporter [Asanoa sp. WMMD1127]MDG4825021.1 MFS transporter [Asanoa sp. WMMD1127]
MAATVSISGETVNRLEARTSASTSQTPNRTTIFRVCAKSCGPSATRPQTPLVPTYRNCFATPQFTPLFLATAGSVGAGTLRGLALAVLVYDATDSPLLAALSLFGSHFAQVAGAMTLLSVADRVPPRLALVAIHLIGAVGTVVLAAPGLPVAWIFVVIGVMGLVGSVHGGVRWGLLGEILPAGHYMVGRSIFNMSVGAMQIAGFAAGGALVALVGARPALMAAVGVGLMSAAIARFGLARTPARASGRPSVTETWRVNVALLRTPVRRWLYLAAWVPQGLAVGNEALFVPYDPAAASVLFIAGAAGMLAGDLVIGRWVPPAWRSRVLTPVLVLLGAPYLLFVFDLAVPVAAAAVAAASGGYASGLILQQRTVDVTPPALRGQALGLHSAGMFTLQAVGASIAGAIAQWTSVSVAIVAMATLTIGSTFWLALGLRRASGAPVQAESAVRAEARWSG